MKPKNKKLVTPGEVSSGMSRASELFATRATTTAQTKLYDSVAYSETEIEAVDYMIEEMQRLLQFMKQHNAYGSERRADKCIKTKKSGNKRI